MTIERSILRRATSANWASADPVLAEGELGFEVDTGKMKIGDGVKTWTALDAASFAGYRDYQDVETLLANTSLAYGPGAQRVAAGDVIRTRAEGFSYEVAAANAVDAHVTTAGGVKLYVRPSGNFAINFAAWGTSGLRADDVTAEFKAFARATVESGCQWIIPPGEHYVNAAEPVVFKTGGTAFGIVVIPRENTACWLQWDRDDAGTAIDCTGWTMTRGTILPGATGSALKKVITLASDDVQFHRVDPYDPYLNREIIFVGKEGTLSRPLSNTYATPASVVATAYEPSRPITIRNLRVLRTGVGPGNAIGAVVVYRDFVTMESPQILIEGGHGTTDGLAAGIHLYSCVGSVIRRPYMDGLLLNGYGYGLFLSTTLLTTIEDGHITNCRRAIAGRDNVGVTIRGGVYSHTLDDHWGDSWLITGVKGISRQGDCFINFAGWDLTVTDCDVRNGRSMVGIRADTPHLGGVLRVSRCRFFSEGELSSSWVVGWNSSLITGSWNAAAKGRMPDQVVLEDITYSHNNTPASGHYLFITGTSTVDYTSFGEVALKGVNVHNGIQGHGIYMAKQSARQKDRVTRITSSGETRFVDPTGNALWVTTADSDSTGGFEVDLSGIFGAPNIRYDLNAVKSVTVRSSSPGQIHNNSHPSTGDGTSKFLMIDCTPGDGFVHSTITNAKAIGCVFSGNYSGVPTDMRFAGCYHTGIAGGLPQTVQNITLADSGAWNARHWVTGSSHMWIDSSGKLRIKSSAPSSDTDGTVVGTQT